MVDKPDPIPGELVNFTLAEYIAMNQLEPLVPFIHQFINAATTNFSSVSALEGYKMGLNPAALFTLINLDASFSVKGGCFKLYEGMTSYLGSNHIVTNAIVKSVTRPSPAHSLPNYHKRKPQHSQQGALHLRLRFSDRGDISFNDSLSVLGLDAQEEAVLVRSDTYYVSGVGVEGPITQADFGLWNFDVTQPFGLPVAPSPIQIIRPLPYGPAALSISSDTDIPPLELIALVKPQLDGFNATLITNVEVDMTVYDHPYDPYFPPETLAVSPTSYTRLDNLQGYRKTYWNTALNTGPGHSYIINNAANFISAFFPPKTIRREEQPAQQTPAASFDVASIAAEMAANYRKRVEGRAEPV